MATRQAELVQECKRLSESCLYTSTTFFVWLKFLHAVKGTLTVLGVVLGGFAGWNVLTGAGDATARIIVAVSALGAGLIPTIISALKLSEHIEDCRRLAGEFKNLQDRFRQAALVWARKEFAEFEKEFISSRDRLETARAESITPPEWCFKRAQSKVKAQDYTFDVDLESGQGS